MNDTGNPAHNDYIWTMRCGQELDQWSRSLHDVGNNQVYEGYRVPMPGEPVTVNGMRGRPELNGMRGEIISNDVDTCGRVVVRLYDSNVRGVGTSVKMRIQPKRLLPMMRSSSSPSFQAQPDRDDVRSCSGVGSTMSGSRPLGSAISASARSSLSRPSGFRPRHPASPDIPTSGCGWMHQTARSGKPSMLLESAITDKVTGPPSNKDRD
mmetsp:Transcript_42785/g.118183  ORF Transcript_42785/g.118183 Transcript_42785/m.118183 type:complete len:209 (+) Transcript_42785:75-701(+)